ncbi:hypothetical protein ACFU99_06725 [Streptomyces sp. NPDC057654]|uniref:hypothetical protein n=1 Tax=Streptomyces sp. NPDC057654 TaxID=3346196 RepID=UPI0036C03963
MFIIRIHGLIRWGLAPDCGDEVSLFKAPSRGRGQYHYENGFLERDFPGDPHNPYMDGTAYFAKERELANNYANHYGDGVIEVRIPADKYAEHFKKHEYPYEGGPLTEVTIPNTEVEKLNEYPRHWHQ